MLTLTGICFEEAPGPRRERGSVSAALTAIYSSLFANIF